MTISITLELPEDLAHELRLAITNRIHIVAKSYESDNGTVRLIAECQMGRLEQLEAILAEALAPVSYR